MLSARQCISYNHHSVPFVKLVIEVGTLKRTDGENREGSEKTNCFPKSLKIKNPDTMNLGLSPHQHIDCQIN